MINTIIDISHHQSYVDFNKLVAGGIKGVIHKCTQGTGFLDSKYTSRKELAKSVGLLWGAYHFGENADAEVQAEWFSSCANLSEEDLAVLDFEEYKDQMTLDQARIFITKMAAPSCRMRYPVLYSGAYFINELLGDKPIDSCLANCPLWIAQYNNKEIKVPPTWQDWTMWQYTDGTDGNQPHYTDGVGNCDRNIFNGDAIDLVKMWR